MLTLEWTNPIRKEIIQFGELSLGYGPFSNLSDNDRKIYPIEYRCVKVWADAGKYHSEIGLWISRQARGSLIELAWDGRDAEQFESYEAPAVADYRLLDVLTSMGFRRYSKEKPLLLPPIMDGAYHRVYVRKSVNPDEQSLRIDIGEIAVTFIEQRIL